MFIQFLGINRAFRSTASSTCLTVRCPVAPFGFNGFSRARQLLLQRSRSTAETKILVSIQITHPAAFSPEILFMKLYFLH